MLLWWPNNAKSRANLEVYIQVVVVVVVVVAVVVVGEVGELELVVWVVVAGVDVMVLGKECSQLDLCAVYHDYYLWTSAVPIVVGVSDQKSFGGRRGNVNCGNVVGCRGDRWGRLGHGSRKRPQLLLLLDGGGYNLAVVTIRGVIVSHIPSPIAPQNNKYW